LSKKLGAFVLACALAALLPASAALAKTHHHKKPKPKPSYYLALGDSLSRGAQPFGPVQSSGLDQTVPTNQGYVNDLFKTEKKKIKGLKLEQLGCLGETTTTMMSGGICHYAAGNQLAQAVRFIHKHKISLITIDIGANDIDNCVSATGSINLPCVQAGEQTIQTNVPKIAQTLRKAAGKKVKIVGMTYYDPFLAEWLTGPSGHVVAEESVQLAQTVNGDLTNDYEAQSFKVADVATAFDTYTPVTTTTSSPFGTVPVAVAEVCEMTWMCQASPKGPNIHANATGYKLIAKTFVGAL
jgi:lysophospholipase L1-like esterase